MRPSGECEVIWTAKSHAHVAGFLSQVEKKNCFDNFALARGSSSERKHMILHSSIIYYSTLHCYRFENALRIRDENEREVNPTPKIAFPFPPIHKPSACWRAHQRAISTQNEPIIALKIQHCSLLCNGMLFIDSNSLSPCVRYGGF